MTDKTFPYININGSFSWRRLDGKEHFENGPAIENFDGSSVWVINGQLHRYDGPAVIYSGGGVEYWERGVFICKRGRIDGR